MKYKIDNIEYEVEIVKKNNKNTYIRVKDDLKIYVTTNYFITKKQIEKILTENIDYLKEMIVKQQKKLEKNNQFYYLGKSYEIIYMQNNQVEIYNNRIFVNDDNSLNKWLNNELKNLYKKRVLYWYEKFEENIPYPKLKFRKMKTRWGVCNKKDLSITLNTELIKYEIECLDYVIVHELTHFIYFNHSKEFWNGVNKYFPNYKQVRKKLKE